MATEYYFIKPDKKEKCYIGKHITHLEKVMNYIYTGTKSSVPRYYDSHDLMIDLIENTHFFDGDDTYDYIKEISQCLFDWINGENIYLDSDISDNYVNWKDYKETGDIIDFIEKFYNP